MKNLIFFPFSFSLFFLSFFLRSQNYDEIQYSYPSPSCQASQYLDPNSNNTCQTCPKDCSFCYYNQQNQIPYCSKCSKNFGISLNPERKCIGCPLGCSNCFYLSLKNGELVYEEFYDDLKVLYDVEEKCVACPKVGDFQYLYSNLRCHDDCKAVFKGCKKCNNTLGKCIQCDSGYNLINDLCILINCEEGKYNVGQGCLTCPSLCLKCANSQTCLSCKINTFLSRGICLSQAEIDKYDSKLSLNTLNFTELLYYQSYFVNKFKLNNETNFIACSSDSDCKNEGNCLLKKCSCKKGFYGTFCNYTLDELKNSADKNKLILQNVKGNSDFLKIAINVTNLLQNLRETTYVKKINNIDTVDLSLDLLDIIIDYSSAMEIENIVSAIGILSNIYEILEESIESDISKYYTKAKKSLIKLVNLEISNKFNEKPFLLTYIKDKNLEIKMIQIRANDKKGINQTIEYISQPDVTDFFGGLKINQDFLNKFPVEKNFVLTLVKSNININKAFDKIYNISSSVLLFFFKNVSLSDIIVTKVDFPFLIKIPKVVDSDASKKWRCVFWDQDKGKWSNENLNWISQNAYSSICKTTTLKLGAEYGIAQIDQKNDNGSRMTFLFNYICFLLFLYFI